MDVELHIARVQQRWRFSEDELAAGERLSVQQLAYDFARLPAFEDARSDEIAEAVLAFLGSAGPSAAGGGIEPMADGDGVLVAEPNAQQGLDRSELS